MKSQRLLLRMISLLLMVCLVFSGCADAVVAEIEGKNVLPEEAKQEISVAIYPFVPDIGLFQSVLTEQWQEIEPDVELVFADWNCYDYETCPDNIDVIMYDALCTTYLAQEHFIQPISVDDVFEADKILPFALEGAMVNGELYGIPFLVCSYFLIHRADDEALAAVDNFSELYSVVMEREEDKRLLINYDMDYPYHYLDALTDFRGEYTTYEELPDTKSPMQKPMDQLRKIKAMQTAEPNLPEDMPRDTFYRSKLFCDGHASCYYGYSEDLSFMGDLVDDLEIRTISFSEKENIQLFFADIVSMGAHVTDPEKKELCKKLMALIGSKAFQQELCFGTGTAQYMLPARFQIYEKAAQQYPMYARLYELVTDERNGIFRAGNGIYEYLENAYNDLG